METTIGKRRALIYLVRYNHSTILTIVGNEATNGCVYLLNQSISARQECVGQEHSFKSRRKGTKRLNKHYINGLWGQTSALWRGRENCEFRCPAEITRPKRDLPAKA